MRSLKNTGRRRRSRHRHRCPGVPESAQRAAPRPRAQGRTAATRRTGTADWLILLLRRSRSPPDRWRSTRIGSSGRPWRERRCAPRTRSTGRRPRPTRPTHRCTEPRRSGTGALTRMTRPATSSAGSHARRGKHMLAEFKAFLLKTNALALAVGVIIGVALGGVVNSLVNDIIMPPIGVLLGGVDFSGLVVFLMARAFLKEAPATPTKTCPFCKESNAVDASKCKACTSAI